MKNTLTSKKYKLVFLFIVFKTNLSLHCSSACTYTQATDSTVTPQCTATASGFSTSCTSCDWNFYSKLTGSTCTPQDKFNSTYSFSSTDWTSFINVVSSSTWSTDTDNTWLRMHPTAYSSVSINWATLFARYGFQCRILFAIPTTATVAD